MLQKKNTAKNWEWALGTGNLFGGCVGKNFNANEFDDLFAKFQIEICN